MKYLKASFANYRSVFTSEKLYNQIPAEDVVNRQRFVLFRILSFTGAIVSLIAFTKMYLNFDNPGAQMYLILALSALLIINFFAVKKIEKLRISYIILLISAALLLHIMSYTCGGIQTAGTFYFSALILYSYMLLGRVGGQYFTASIIVHVIYLYWISSNTQLTSYNMFKNDREVINQDFLINAILTFLLITSLCNYLQSGRNVVIQRITQQRDELKEANFILEQKNNELDKFASVASHDLKAPLRAIGNLSDMIIEDHGSELNNQVVSNLSVIKGRVSRMENLINGLLNYSRIERNQNIFTEVQSRYLFQQCTGLISKNKHVEIEISEGMPLLFTDKIKLNQVFHHLVDNAIRFNAKPIKRIGISCIEQKDHWLFSLKDNGPGIDKRYHEKIFVIFQTLSRRDDVESTGAGLAIVKKIVEDQGGTIWLESEKGNGSTFLFTWQKNKIESECMQYQVNEYYA